MTPNEKAVSMYNSMRANTTKRNHAKRCALIAVDEMINMITSNDVDVWDIDIFNYWQEVKQEIEKL